MSLGTWIKLHRRQKRWTQTTLAEALAVTQEYVSALERDKAAPGPEVIYRLARVFAADVAAVYALAYPDRAALPLPPPDAVAAARAALDALAPALLPEDWDLLLVVAQALARKNQQP